LVGQVQGVPLDFQKIVDPKAMGFTIRAFILVPKGFHNEVRLVLDTQEVTIGSSPIGFNGGSLVSVLIGEQKSDLI